MGKGEADLGGIKINPEVICTIASMAAVGVEGVVSLSGKFTLSERWGKKDSDKGVSVSMEGDHATITIEINVEYGINIYETAQKVQRVVKDAVESMAGLPVAAVNVSIAGIAFTEERKKEITGDQKGEEK